MNDNTQPDARPACDDLTLAMAPETMRSLGYRLVDMLTEELADPTRRPVFPPPLVAYVSEHAHACLDRSAALLGIGRNHLRKIPVDTE